MCTQLNCDVHHCRNYLCLKPQDTVPKYVRSNRRECACGLSISDDDDQTYKSNTLE